MQEEKCAAASANAATQESELRTKLNSTLSEVESLERRRDSLQSEVARRVQEAEDHASSLAAKEAEWESRDRDSIARATRAADEYSRLSSKITVCEQRLEELKSLEDASKDRCDQSLAEEKSIQSRIWQLRESATELDGRLSSLRKEVVVSVNNKFCIPTRSC